MSSTAMFTGVTGLLAHQRRLDVVANNIANVNTTGYRASRVLFQDLFSQTLRGGTPPVGSFGGQNPYQVGLGVGIASIDVLHDQGSLFTTGVASDFAIQGNGFFVLSDGSGSYYTRDGSFALNANGVLIDPATGMRVQGYMADSNGVVDVNTTTPSDIVIPAGETSIVQATSSATLGGNLEANAAEGTEVVRTVRVYDSLGTPRDVRLTFTKRAQVDDGTGTLYNAWVWQAEFEGTDVTNVPAGESGVVLFDANGAFHLEGSLTAADAFTDRSALPSQDEVSIPDTSFTGPSIPVVPFDFSIDFSSVTELAADSDVTITRQDGYPRGVLESFNIGADGIINGVFTNGLSRVMGQVALATFTNIGGLARHGDNMFIETAASGVAQVGAPSTGGRGTVAGGVLEGSNVDLGTEFSHLIITQRGYQANARTITAADTLLQETVNLVR